MRVNDLKPRTALINKLDVYGLHGQRNFNILKLRDCTSR